MNIIVCYLISFGTFLCCALIILHFCSFYLTLISNLPLIARKRALFVTLLKLKYTVQNRVLFVRIFSLLEMCVSRF